MDQAIPPKVSAVIVQIVRNITGLTNRPAKPCGGAHWQLTPGAYVTGDPDGCVAVCMLTSGERLDQVAKIPGVAIAGRLYSANLGLEKMIPNLLANPRIRYLVLAGKDSPFFQSGQAVQSLMKNGINPEGFIIGAQGHYPRITGISPAQIERFRSQFELVNLTGETDPARLAETIAQLAARSPGPFAGSASDLTQQKSAGSTEEFLPLKPGGRREPLSMDPKGFYVISLDEAGGEIVVHHYLANHQPAHVMRGRSGEAVLLGLLREGLVSQMSHAGYLGAELAKAESALRLNLRYEQDRPLRAISTAAD